MRSFIPIDSIYIDLSNPMDKSTSNSDPAGECERPFSIRGYVSEMREKDWKMCWPFPLKDNHEELSEQSGVQKRSSQSSQPEIASDAHQQAPIPITFEGMEIDLNTSTNLSSGSDHVAVNNEKEKQAQDGKTNQKIGVEGLNHQISRVPGPEIYEVVRLEARTNDRGHKGKEVINVELDTSNLKRKDKGSGRVCKEGKLIVADKQTQQKKKMVRPILGKGTMVSEENSITDHTTKLKDRHPGKSTGLHRKKPRKVRLLRDLLSKSGETKTEKVTKQGSPAKATSIPQAKVDVQGDSTKTSRPRKRKFIVDEDQIPEETCFGTAEADLQNLQEVANAETVDTILSNVFKVVFEGNSKPNAVEKNKKVQVVENHHLISEPLKRKQKQNQDNMDTVNEVYGSKATSRCVPTITEEGINDFPFHAKRTEKEPKLSKGKGKMLQVDEEMASKSSGRKSVPVEDSFEHTRAKEMPNVTVTTPIHSAEGALKEKDLEERLNNSLDSFEQSRPIRVRPNVNINLPSHHAEELAANRKDLEEGLHIPLDRFEHRRSKATPVHSVEDALNEKMLEEALKLSLNSYMPPPGYNRSHSHQLGNQPLSLPSQGATSAAHQSIRQDREAYDVREPVIPLKRRDISGNRFSYEEVMGIQGARNTAKARKQLRILESSGDQASAEESEEDLGDDVAKDIMEFKARNQYERERGHPDSSFRRNALMTIGNSVNDNGNRSLMQDDRRGRPEGRYGNNGVIIGGRNMRLHNRNSGHSHHSPDSYQLNMRNSGHSYHSPDSYQLNMNSLPQTPTRTQSQSLFDFEVSQYQMKQSSGFQFSPVSSNQFSGAQNHRFNRSFSYGGSSGATNFQMQRGHGLQDTFSQQNDRASHMWRPLSANQVALGCEMFGSKAVSQSSNRDVHRQNIRRDIDLNYINLDPSDHVNLNRQSSFGSLSRMNAEYSFPGKYSGRIDQAHQNIRGSPHLYSNVPSMNMLSFRDANRQPGTPFNVNASAPPLMLNRPPFLGGSNANLQIGAPKASFDSQRRPLSDYYSRSYNLSERSQGSFLGFQKFRASSSIRLDDKFTEVINFNGQIPSKPEKKDNMRSRTSIIIIEDDNNTILQGLEKEASPQRQPEVRQLAVRQPEVQQRQLEVHDARETLMPLRISSGPITCSVSRNPAEFTMPGTENEYMINGEDLKFDEAGVSGNKPDLLALPSSSRQRKKSKPRKLKKPVRD